MGQNFNRVCLYAGGILNQVKAIRGFLNSTANRPRSGLILWSPHRVSRKREFYLRSVETFGNVAAKSSTSGRTETFNVAKSPQLAGPSSA